MHFPGDLSLKLGAEVRMLLVVVKRFWSSEVGSGVLKRFWNSVLELHAWCFEVGSGVVKRFWSSILELHAWCFEFGRGVFWVEKWCRGAHF